MVDRHALLPPEATALEVALSEALDRSPELAPGVVALLDIKDDPSGGVVPYLINEYGLEEIEEFFPIRAETISEGLRWRRLVGTPEAVRVALRWIGYQARIVEHWVGRRRWNNFDFAFRLLPANDYPDLSRIAKIADISTPYRSRFRRGFVGYDVPALSADHNRLDGSLLDTESGHVLDPGGPLWSFGRSWEAQHLYTQAEGLALGNWLAPSSETPLSWSDLTVPWSSASFPWGAQSDAQRRTLLSGWFRGRDVRLCLREPGGSVIGYRRCRVVEPVRIKVGGPYVVADTTYEPTQNGDFLLVEAMTGFDDADGSVAATASLLVDGDLAPGMPAGRLWLDPDQMTGGVEIAVTPVSVSLRATVRDCFKFLVRF